MAAVKKGIKVFLWSLTAALLVLGAGAAFLFLVNRFGVSITLAGEETMTVEYGDSYADPGAQAALQGSLVLKSGYAVEVLTEDRVNPQRVGTYTVTYRAECLWFSAEKVRTVKIVDTKAPVITLVSNPDTYTLPGQPYEEEGFSAIDNYDGDITHRVTRQEEDGVVFYRVEDSSGNVGKASREIRYDDPIAPELSLLGEGEMTLTAGTAFEDPGVTAQDNVDGDITSRIKCTGTVDIYHAGTYTLTYTVSDSYKNTASVTRTVTVEPVWQPDVVVPGGKLIYLTFDDGPGGDTGDLLDVLARYNVKATFFVVDNGNYGLLRRIVQEGHSIGVHTASHDYEKVYASEEAYFADLTRMRSIISAETGVDTTLIRFPGGSSNTVSSFNKGIMTRLTSAVTDMGYQYFDWNVDSQDAGGASTPEEVFENVKNGVEGKNTSVVLQHDIKPYSVEAVEKILIWGIANGYTFLPLKTNSPTCHHGVNN